MNMNILKNLSKGLVFCSALAFLAGCSKEESAPLPDLPKVELPTGLAGLYSGMLPCENCKVRMVQITLAEDSTLTFKQMLQTDTVKTDSLNGKYSFSDGKLSVEIEDGTHLKFLVESSGALSLLTGAGTVYEDENGMKADLIKIFNVPKKKGKEGGEP